MSLRLDLDSALLRADNYILKQMHKFEQRRNGREKENGPLLVHKYGQIPTSSHRYGTCGPPSHHLPPQMLPAPQGWRQEFDVQSQRWYYVDLATGRAQWDLPPPSYQESVHKAPIRAQTFADEKTARKWQDEVNACARWQNGMSNQSQHPVRQGQYMGVNELDGRVGGKNGVTLSPRPESNGRPNLPPGAHLDLRTGQVVLGMFPPGQTPQQWASEVGRV